MTHPDDLVERVAKAIYEADPYISPGEFIDGFRTSPDTVTDWDDLDIEAEVYRKMARACLSEASAWLTESVAKASETRVSASALHHASADPSQWRAKP